MCELDVMQGLRFIFAVNLARVFCTVVIARAAWQSMPLAFRQMDRRGLWPRDDENVSL
jgi:hypothetical protein